MEQRCGRRRALDHAVTVLAGTGEPLTGIARNVSAGGIYLESLSGTLRAWEFVELLLVPPGRTARLWRWSALVVRAGPCSAALMFDRLRFSDLQSLMNVLNQKQGVRSRVLNIGPVPLPGLAGPRLH